MKKYITNKNIKLHYISKRNNKSNNWCLFIPGAVNSAEEIEVNLKKSKFNYFILSLRGRGNSESPLEGYSLKDQASDIEVFLNSINKDYNISIFAHSVGVPISIAALSENKRKIDDFIMCEFAPFYPPFDKNWATSITKQKITSISKIAVNGIVKEARYIDVSKELKKVNSNIHLMVGNTKFSALREKEKNALKDLIPNINIIEINSGHDPLSENNKIVLEVLNKILK